MRRKILLVAAGALLLLTTLAVPAGAADQVTIGYGGLVLHSEAGVLQATHWNDVWDLTQGDLTLSYDLDMSQITQPPLGAWDWHDGWDDDDKDGNYDPGEPGEIFGEPEDYPDTYTPWVEVGLRGVGAPDYNPGPPYTYQGKCGGWMTSESDDWLGSYTIDPTTGVVLVDDGPETQDGDDKHSLAATSGVGEWHYDVLDGDGAYGVDSSWNTVLPMFGSHNNHGFWYDRDGVDQWQADDWINTGINAPRINTGGLYHIEITYHMINPGLGVMFARINGSVMQGFYTSGWDVPQLYPAGLSFKGDMKQMQVFAGIFSYDPAGWDYGHVTLSNLTVTGYAGVADPLLPDFTYTLGAGGAVTFDSSATHGGMGPYEYAWDFGDGGTSTEANPTHTFSTSGPWAVTLTVTPFRCTPQSVTKEVGWGYIVVDKVTNPAGSSQVFQFTPSYGPGFSLTDASPPNTSGPLVPGTYAVAELLPAGWSAGVPSCNDGSSHLAIGLSPGETVTCTFTNTKVPGTSLTIAKVADPADGTDFSFGGDLGAFALASGESKTFADLNPGEYDVEEALAAGWTLDDVVCTTSLAVAAVDFELVGESVSVNLRQGEAVSCTFYNSSEEEEEEAQLTIAKVARTENPDLEDAEFNFTGDLGDFALASGESESFDLAPGVYAVTELLVDPWVLEAAPDGIVCTGGGTVVYDQAAAKVTVSLADGDDVICTFHNYDEDTIGPDLPYTGTSGALLPALLGGLSILVLGLGLWVFGLMKRAET